MGTDPVRLPGLLRGLAVLLALPALVGGLVVAARLDQSFAPRRPGDPPAMVEADATPQRMAIQRAALESVIRSARRLRGAAHSRVTTLPDGRAVLVLTPRPHPYGVRALSRVPQAVSVLAHRRLLIRIPIVVTPGARLLLHSRHVRELLLSSTPSGFASVVSLGGGIRLRGTPRQPLTVASFQPGSGRPDADIDDGRAFVLDRDGWMNLFYVHADSLGFGEGTSSGMAWVGTPQNPARGVVSHSTFTRNRFGAYTFHARHMTWVNNRFLRNEAYGFDPHDFSDHFLVRDNVASGNGRHGFIFSRGCTGNVIVGNTATFNRGHGFMIDDGRSGVTSGPRRMVASSHNLLARNRAFDNGHSGIEIEGGKDNAVLQNRLAGNFTGIRYRASATGRVEANRVRQSRLYGIEIEADSGAVLVRNNSADGSWSDFTADRPVRMAGNHFAVIHAESAANGRRRLTGVLPRTSEFLEFRPAAVAWLVVLLVPLVAWGRNSLHGSPARRAHRSGRT